MNKKLWLLVLVVFVVGGIVNTIVVLTVPPIEVPTVSDPTALSQEEASRIEALTLERDIRQAWREGLVRGLNWAQWVYTPLLVILALDYLVSVFTGRPPKIETAVRRWWRRKAQAAM